MQRQNWHMREAELVSPQAARTVTPLRGPTQVYLDGLAPITRECARGRLDVIASLLSPGHDATTFAWHELTYRETTLAKSLLGERYAWQNANNYLTALKGVLREAFRLGLMTADAYHRAVDVSRFKGSTIPAGRLVHPEEIATLFAHLAEDKTPFGARDLAILGTYRATGVRRTELLTMRIEDFDPIAVTFKVLGKGNKRDEIAAPRWLAPLMDAWLRVRGNDAGALYCKMYQGGAIDPQRRPLGEHGISHVLKRRLRQAGVAPFTIHDFRRTLATELIEVADLVAAKNQLRHANIQTTMRYDRRPLERLRSAVQLVPDPFES